MKFVCNLDWVEFYCKFDTYDEVHERYVTDVVSIAPRTNYSAVLRPYGTRVYRYICDVSLHSRPLMTICYDPLSKMSAGGIMNDAMCHVKLENEWCYNDSWAEVFQTALRSFRIKPIRPARIDIAGDVQYFSCGMPASSLAMGLMQRRYYKIHQSRWRANGNDASELSWNSLAFGSKSSPVFTRFYNKSLELREGKDKQYIRECWESAGLDVSHDVWRVEFALTDTGKEVIDSETGETFDLSITDLDSHDKVTALFCHYATHYWDIRKVEGDKRRYDCERLPMFPESPNQFLPVQRPRYSTCTKTDRLVLSRLASSLFIEDDYGARCAIIRAIESYQSSHRIVVWTKDALDGWKDWVYSDPQLLRDRPTHDPYADVVGSRYSKEIDSD